MRMLYVLFIVIVILFSVVMLLSKKTEPTIYPSLPKCPPVCPKRKYKRTPPPPPPATDVPKQKPSIINKVKDEFDVNAKYRVDPTGNNSQKCGGSQQNGEKGRQICNPKQ